MNHAVDELFKCSRKSRNYICYDNERKLLICKQNNYESKKWVVVYHQFSVYIFCLFTDGVSNIQGGKAIKVTFISFLLLGFFLICTVKCWVNLNDMTFQFKLIAFHVNGNDRNFSFSNRTPSLLNFVKIKIKSIFSFNFRLPWNTSNYFKKLQYSYKMIIHFNYIVFF